MRSHRTGRGRGSFRHVSSKKVGQMHVEQKPLYKIHYSDGTSFYSHEPRKKSREEASEMGLTIVKVEKIRKPSLIQRFQSWD